VAKVILFPKTPSRLCRTPSINRGRVENTPVLWEESPAPPLFIEEVARSDGGVFGNKMTFASPCFYVTLINMLPQIDNIHFWMGILVKTEESDV